ncbi:hypothetical protein PMI21_02059 [Pseudomonas sp. GM18]|nr:hypothetical protein PMI21_02059 [Pseudomonas sp. GM18]
MMHRIGFLLSGTLALALILPRGAYWVGLYRISQYPSPPSQAISTAQREWVWSLAKDSGEPVIVQLSPYSYLYDLFILKGNNDRNRQVAAINLFQKCNFRKFAKRNNYLPRLT